jgi:hypothetical protein
MDRQSQTANAVPSRIAVFALDDGADAVTLVRTATLSEFGAYLGMGADQTFWTSNAGRLHKTDVVTGAVRYDVNMSISCEVAVPTVAPDALWCAAYRNPLVARLSPSDSSVAWFRIDT